MTPRVALSRAASTAVVIAALAGPLSAQASHAGELEVGRRVRGEITASDPRLGDDSHYDAWRLRGTPGQRVTIVMESDRVDAYLIVGESRDPEERRLVTNDDGAGGTNARIELALEREEYWVFANTLGDGQMGSYTLSVMPTAGPATLRMTAGGRHGTIATALVYTRE